jgi:hypothetical protein
MNIFKNIIIVVIIGVVAALGNYFAVEYTREEPPVQNDDQAYHSVISRQYTGTINRNSAHISEPWYLTYQEINPQREEKVMLGFEGSALCSRNGETIGCADFEFRPNEVVKISGTMKSDYLAVNNMEVLQQQLPPLATDIFKESKEYGFYGTLTLTGYVEVQKRICNPGDMCGETVDYVYFVFPNTDNEAIKKFTGSMDGNTFVAGDRVGIGCQRATQNKIVYENDADIGWQVGEIISSDYTRLMASTKAKPVQLKMTREVYTSGRGAPDCYSHFRNFDVL